MVVSLVWLAWLSLVKKLAVDVATLSKCWLLRPLLHAQKILLGYAGMPTLPPQRTSLCLFCAFTTRSRLHPPPQPRLRFLPKTQVAYRTGGLKGHGKKKTDARERLHNRQISPSAQQLRIVDPEGSDNRRSDSRRDGKHDRYGTRFTIGVREPLLVSETRKQMEKLRREFTTPAFLKSLQLTADTFHEQWVVFERSVNQWIKRATPELESLAREASRGKQTLLTRIRYQFYAQVCGGRFTQAELENQKDVADLRYPTEWYPATREIPRTVHLHVGPTNSGKTYHALKRLEEAERGIYLGPLRLLAHEIYTRLNAKGKHCALITGEEQRLPEGETKMWSCTVEMAPLNAQMDVAVLDEIQMINHPERGWAWTQAFLGIQAKELHLCGEARTVPLIRELSALVGDKVHVHEYERLTPLKVAERPLGSLESLEKGDCVVVFSVIGIHALRREIEKKTGKKCAMVYGSLPPETRAQQARLFNEPDNDYDYLVASDAVGMGLNLSIKRVIFESTVKSNGTKVVPLPISDLKQIAGRAGRYKSSLEAENESKAAIASAKGESGVGFDDTKPTATKSAAKPRTVGICTTMDAVDFQFLKHGMNQEPEPITSAGLFPPSLVVERFASYFPPGTPFSYIMLRLHEISDIHPRFHLCALKDQLAIADVIHTVENLSISERIILCAAPTSMKDNLEKEFLRYLAECIAEGKSGQLLDLPNLPLDRLDEPASGERAYLYSLEQLHKMIITYLWLSFRFPQVLTSRSLALHVKELTEGAIEKTLTEFSWVDDAQRRRRKMRERAEGLQSGEGDLKQPRKIELDGMQQSFAKGSPGTDDQGTYEDEDDQGAYSDDDLRVFDKGPEPEIKEKKEHSDKPVADMALYDEQSKRSEHARA
jgi:ATP-dependent RNA helicase SUPV3L1/SUV3